MRFGSLFSGIGGMDLGLERAGMSCAWQVEINDYAQKVLEKHWPDVRRFRDVRDVGSHNLESVDLIAGGFPCQDISVAGKGAGIEGERSGLWSEFYRIICELRPRFVLVENVAALLGRGMGRVLGDLAACGYDAEWECIPAAAIGAPHFRDRVWIIAYTVSGRFGQLLQQERQQECEPATNSRRNGEIQSLAYTHEGEQYRRSGIMQMGRRSFEKEAARNGFPAGTQWASEPTVGRVAHGIPSRVDRLGGLGNAVVPQVAEWIGKRIIANT